MAGAPIPLHGRWAWDVRGDGRAVRVSTHVDEGVLNVSIWRDDLCVGTARLQPDEAAALVGGLTDGIAELAGRQSGTRTTTERRMHALELRMAQLEGRSPTWRRTLAASWDWARRLAAPPR
jgi:hypothetical protein